MTPTVISGASWERRPWDGAVHSVPMSERAYFVVHHDGSKPITRTGSAIPQAIDDSHHNNGWVGIGYNFVVDQAGNIYEGRGWKLVGAHCPGRNRDGIGVQIAVGGDQEPSEAALASVVAIYNEATRLAGHALIKTYHGAHYATACAGAKLNAWVKAGMPLKTSSGPVKAAPVKRVSVKKAPVKKAAPTATP